MKEPSRAGEAARAFLARAAAASGSLPSLDSSIVVRWMESSFFAGSRPNEWQRSKTFSFGERRTTMGSYDNKDEIIAALQAKVDTLESLLQTHYNSFTSTYYASPHAAAITDGTDGSREAIPQRGMPARHVAEIIDQLHSCDFNPRLNTSSYVNVVSEPEERHVAALGATVNLADASVYPASVLIHDTVVNMIAELWHAPPPPAGSGGNYSGAGTVGSTEACLLAGLALKFRWRDWYARKVGKKPNSAEVLGVRPNLVISTCYQAAWEKFFRYFDVQPKFCKPKLLENSMSVDARELCALCDEETIGVVAILGNHYNGNYDPVWEINEELQKVNEAKGLQVGIHIDAASGGFIAPFQPEMASKSFDFRLQNVMSMSSSGHKFGESICGTGWVIFRHREDLAEHIAVTVTYLGGHCDSLTLNFSRPASGVYVQYYKLLRLGMEGYRSKVWNQMKVASYLRESLRNMKNADGINYFQILDGGDRSCLPVVAARLNPELDVPYDDIDLQHALSESLWYVSGYALGFEDPCGGDEELSLCSDVGPETTMFRIVVKSNLTMRLAQNLKKQFEITLPILDSMEDGYRSMHSAKELVRKAEAAADDVFVTATVVKAAKKWMSRRKSAKEKLMGYEEEKPASTRRLRRGSVAC